MKILLAFAVTLVLSSASPAHAQSTQGNSDDFNCNHGQPGDRRTMEACKRLRNTDADAAAQPGSQQGSAGVASTQADSSAPPPAAFRQGQADRARYEAWVHGLSGDYLAGATYWEANRSVPRHAPCGGPGSPATSATWTDGCLAAERQLNVSDQLRHSSPIYRLGWNHPPGETPPSPAPVSPPAIRTASDIGELPAASTPSAAPDLPPANPSSTQETPIPTPAPSSSHMGLIVVLSKMDFNSFYGLGIIVITIPIQHELSYVGEDVYWRNGDATEKAHTAKQIAALVRRF